ncbi:MAG TPA: hypothetical protein VK638_34475 [Edaphobacter sp.]|nr:hypothetical protein [Edaphobacter sp.]
MEDAETGPAEEFDLRRVGDELDIWGHRPEDLGRKRVFAESDDSLGVKWRTGFDDGTEDLLQSVLKGAAGSINERPAVKPFPREWDISGKMLVLKMTDEVERRGRLRTRKLKDARLLTDLGERREGILKETVVFGKVPCAALLVDNGKEHGIGLVDSGPAFAVAFDSGGRRIERPEHDGRGNNVFAVDEEGIGERDEQDAEVLGDGRATVMHLVNDEKVDFLSSNEFR